MVRAQRSTLGRVEATRGHDDVTVRLVRYRPGEAMRPHAHATAGMTLIVAGGFLDRTEGREAVCRPLTLIVKPADAEHDTRVGPEGALSLHFELSARGLERLQARGADATRCRYLFAGPATADLLRLLDRRDAPGHAGATEILADAILDRDRAGLQVESPDVDAFARRASFPTTRAAAEAAGMHPVAFARSFRRRAGRSPSLWRLHRRLSQAAGELAAGHGGTAGIACAAGFADQSHLGRLFKRETGLSPGRYRALVHAFLEECA